MSAEQTGKMELITPQQAAQILELRNKTNRPIRPGTVSQYAREMKEGRWFPGGNDAICFSVVNGELLNGQHRLTAVVEANIPVKFYVIRNVDAKAFAYMDIGAKRNISDRTRLDRAQSDIVTALIRVCGAGGHAAGNPTEVLEVYNKLQDHITPFVASKGKAAKGATACHRAALVMLSHEGIDLDFLTSQFSAFANSTEAMAPALAAMHSRIYGKRARISTNDREEVFSEAIKAYTNRTDKLRDIIREYRLKFDAIIA